MLQSLKRAARTFADTDVKLAAIVVIGVIILTALDLSAVFYLETRVFLPIGAVPRELALQAKWDALFVLAPVAAAAWAAYVVVPLAILTTVLARGRRTIRVWSLTAAIIFGQAWILRAAERIVLDGLARSEFSTVADRAQPILDALNAYQAEYLVFPNSLDDLVPAFLPAVPDTGLAGYPHFQYRKSIGSADYELYVPVPGLPGNSDVFTFSSSGPPQALPSGKHEKIGEWDWIRQ